jgi:hypothetical protein
MSARRDRAVNDNCYSAVVSFDDAISTRSLFPKCFSETVYVNSCQLFPAKKFPIPE